MAFSIITPSFRSARWLKLCIPSVADQEVEHEHIVQDSCSDDGTQDWLPQDPRVNAFIEKDQGMYDAVNRGLRRATGDILSYINCDEQYLPGALARVEEYFKNHPEVDVAFGDMVVVDPQGQYLCSRQVCLPHKGHTWVGNTLSVYTCATFFRRRLIEERVLLFDPKFRELGDAEWVLRLIKNKVTMGLLKTFTSAFTLTGVNLSFLPNAAREKKELAASAPVWMRYSRPMFILHYRLRRWLAGSYRPRPFSFAIYTEQSPTARVTREVRNPTYKWPKDLPNLPRK